MTERDPMSAEHSNCSGDAAAYALGALEPAEAEAFRRHMAECVVCREEAREFERVARSLPLASPRQELPSELRRRVRRAVRAEPRGVGEAGEAAGRARGGVPPGVADSAGVGAGADGGTGSAPGEPRLGGGRAGEAGSGAGGAVADRARRPGSRGGRSPSRGFPVFGGLGRPIAWVGALAAVVVIAVAGVLAFGGSSSKVRVYQASVGQAELRVAGTRGDLIVRNLAPPAAGRIYELWIVHGHSRPAPSTLFSVTSTGTADLGVPGNFNGVSTVMVTQEHAGGTTTPTTSPVIVANVG